MAGLDPSFFDEIIVVNPGRSVICDICGDDWTDRPESGGMIFGTNGVCPDCEPRLRASAKRYNEESHIKFECPKGESFADWIRRIR